MAHAPTSRPEPPEMDEKGAPINGEPQQLNERMFVQLLVYTDVLEPEHLLEPLRSAGLRGAMYANFNDPHGVGIVTVSDSPDTFTEAQRDAMQAEAFRQATLQPAMTMIGRTYGSGRERDLANWLLEQVPKRLAAPEMPWGIWYPLKRKPEFYQLEHRDSGRILAEHGMLGRTYGEAGLAQDIRLKCFGLDRDDNEFLIGLVGPQLYPLSKLVEDMRQTQQTANWLENLGPFFVGKRIATFNLD